MPGVLDWNAPAQGCVARREHERPDGARGGSAAHNERELGRA